jgi:alcohol dehydrogenase
MGIHHGVSQLLGGRTGISHGLANALVLPHAIRFNADVVPDELTRIAAVFADGDDVAAAVERFRESWSARAPVGVRRGDIDAVARLPRATSMCGTTSRRQADVRAILEAAW